MHWVLFAPSAAFAFATFTFGIGTVQASPPAPDSEAVTTINGSVPPGDLQPLEDVFTMIDTIQVDGNRWVAFQAVRRVGTRTPIHIHEYGGLTCVLSGTMTDFVEGREPMTVPAGDCYYMPPNVPMSASNLGPEDVRLIDIFDLPPGAPTMTRVEPG